MRVYGSSVHDKADPAACTDSKLVVPIAAGNKAQLKSQVASYTPTGWTPISYSLGEAGKDVSARSGSGPFFSCRTARRPACRTLVRSRPSSLPRASTCA